MTYISLQNAVKSYGNGEAAVTALHSVDMHVEKGEFISVMGASGSGKSTLLSILGGLNTPDSGDYIVDDVNVYQLSSDGRADFRRNYLGFVFQSFHLAPYLNLLENVMLPLAPLRMKSKIKRELAFEALERVGLGDKAKRLPNQVSGGEQERTGMARAVVNQPSLLLADEPTGNLDQKNGREIMGLIGRLNKEGMTVIMVTHNAEYAAFAGSTLLMKDGIFSPREQHGEEARLIKPQIRAA